MDLSLLQNFFNLDTYFFKQRVLRASKKKLEREILTIVDHCKNFLSPIKERRIKIKRTDF